MRCQKLKHNNYSAKLYLDMMLINHFKLIGLPVSEVEFPSVVICSQGFNMETVIGIYTKLISDKWKNETGREIPLSAIQFTKLLSAKRTRSRVNFYFEPVWENCYLYTFKLLTTITLEGPSWLNATTSKHLRSNFFPERQNISTFCPTIAIQLFPLCQNAFS